MIIDLGKRGERSMFITEQVAYIKANYSGGWTVRFATSPRFFQYNEIRQNLCSSIANAYLYYCCPVKVLRGKK